MQISPLKSLGRSFIPERFLPSGEGEYYLRNRQSGKPADTWRNLRPEELETLVKNGNTAENWETVLVADQFSPHQVLNCQFFGLVRVGRLEEQYLTYHDMSIPVGLSNSLIINCDIGDNTAIHHVRYMAYYIISDHVILSNIDEMHVTNHAKFGNGIVKDGEDEETRIRLDLINEAGGRNVMPFDGMLPADAYFWAKFRDDGDLLERMGQMTQRMFDSRRGFYGTVGESCVVKNCRIIKDVKVGPAAYIKGANKLKNLTINSSPEEPTQIGEGVELVNGIIGLACHVFYGCKAVRFVLGDNSSLKYGARLIHSYLGDNSTVSCCELLNNLIFPAHEQHHNNSFLIASLVMGQSNIAAAATIGSNHNSRSPDGEIQAGRGFWPGLCVSLKHNSRFVSFVLLSKGDYPFEMDVPLPFCLATNDVAADRLTLMPAYWWMYNMYALARNSWKFQARDARKHKRQNVEFDSFAPDTAEEMFAAMAMLEAWTARAHLLAEGDSQDEKTPEELSQIGRGLLTGPIWIVDKLEILAPKVENSRRKVVVLKTAEGYRAYRRMLHYYAVKNLMDYMQVNAAATMEQMCKKLTGPRCRDWVNLGGQLVMVDDFKTLRADIKSGKIDDWHGVHERYDELWEKYPLDKQAHAFATLLELLGVEKLTPELWSGALDEAVDIQRYICDQTYTSRKKDDENPFRQITFATTAEMKAVLGTAEDNSFVKQVRRETKEFEKLACLLK